MESQTNTAHKQHGNESRILYITHEYGKRIYGGIGRIINIVTAYNYSSGLDFFVLLIKYSFFNKIPFFRLFKQASKNHLRIFPKKWLTVFLLSISARHRGSAARGFKPALKNIYRMFFFHPLIAFLKRAGVNIVHVMHTGEEIAACVGMIKHCLPAVKIIYSCHSILKHEQKVRKNNSEMLKYEQTILSNSDHIHFLNSSSVACFIKCYPEIIKKTGYSIIPNAVDEKEHQEISIKFMERLSKKADARANSIVLCISRWSYGKGLEFLLDAACKVVEHTQNIRFIIAGRKSYSWENAVRNYVKTIDKKIKSLKDYVIPLGWLNDKERNTTMTLADIWVMPSQLEYFPYSILEPVIRKLPVISSRIDSVTEILDENTECLCYDTENIDELSAKILYLIAKKNARRQLATNAYKKIKQKYSPSVILNLYYEMYLSRKIEC
jgi:glycosyltransferase involved in cell wall biosynthesis